MKLRIVAVSAILRELAIPAITIGCLVASGAPANKTSGAILTTDRPARALPIGDAAESQTASAQPLDASSGAQASLDAQVSNAGNPSPDTATPPVHAEPEAPDTARSIVETANAAASQPDALTGDGTPALLLDDCALSDDCVDQYLFDLYTRAPKEDAVGQQEEKKVTEKRKGKLVTVTRRWTFVTEENFSWKDPKAASRAGMSLPDYVIGGIDRDFKLKLFQMLHAAEDAGLLPGISSGFRDDYRQSIATGLKAANNRSYHGGSLRGGYGHGLAADIVSTKGEDHAERLVASRVLWKWIDTHGSEFGLGRPYLDRDPPHVAPVDGQEYADHRPGFRIRQAEHHPAKKIRVAEHKPNHPAKRARTAKSLKTTKVL